MSRAAVSKSRADKGSKPPPAHTPVVAHEIVPGKFTDQDWYGKFVYILPLSYIWLEQEIYLGLKPSLIAGINLLQIIFG